jgi:hypothetical protein
VQRVAAPAFWQAWLSIVLLLQSEVVPMSRFFFPPNIGFI